MRRLMCPLRHDRLSALEEHEQIGRPVKIDIDDRPPRLLGPRIELLNEIDAIVEVAVGFASDERTSLVVFLDVRAAVEIGIERDTRESAVPVVDAPDVGPPVAVVIFRAQVRVGLSRQRGHTERGRKGAHARQQASKATRHLSARVQDEADGRKSPRRDIGPECCRHGNARDPVFFRELR